MVQAARSGKQNILEGSQASGSSRETEINLTNVRRNLSWQFCNLPLLRTLLFFRNYLGLQLYANSSKQGDEAGDFWVAFGGEHFVDVFAVEVGFGGDVRDAECVGDIA